ncbi:alpha-amylase family glycosyl hydrolase [Bacteroides sp. 519]|uniref:alpha-amylase family glycosyl hydrolase n=1 Tax=Bacteroides sp. 519 TaxID=2302937 RepID=UPI0013D16AEB|nr:alpha-amylase family glycosyl hydrolase [Bacteroides sp. 519]NDV56975.1 alpha-amylase [Bacteroides sp. 519]
MKKNIFFYWILLITLCVSSCSDNNDEPEPTPPDPPGQEYIEGINQFPKEFKADEEVEIVFKASKTSALYSYAGDVYVHIGVVEGTNWLYVPADWDKNIAKCKMTKLENNVWSLTLSPNIRSWFGVAEGVSVQKIGIVFRSADGTKKGIENDSFISVEDKTFTPGETVFAPQPANTVDGINVTDPSTVTLVFYDKDLNGKHKDYAYVIGDFNDWKVDSEYQMKRDEATSCWWITLSELESGKEYAFQYYLGSEDGVQRIADPYTEKILDPYNDKYIPASTYPNLRTYPADKTFGIASTFRTVMKEDVGIVFFDVEDKHNLIIYEMLFRDFTTSGDINGAIEKLDYLQSLGVNAIELMPVQEFDGNDSWGYNPCFYFALDKAYGTKEMYHKFIRECHKRGMAVIFDVVYNHATGSNPFAQLYWDATNNRTAANNPWFNVKEPHPYGVFHDFNHESALVRTFVKRNLKFLLEEYKIDGFRFDMTKGFTQKQSTESTASDYDASRIAILKDYNAAIKAVHPEAIVILEHFAELKEEKELAEDGMMLWRNANEAYCQTAMGWDEKSAFTHMVTYNTKMPFGGWVGYMESHDEERTSFKAKTWGDGAIKSDLTTRMKQAQVNAAFFFTVPGPKMLWQFGELGYDISIEENGRTGKKPILWDYYNIPERKGLYDTYSKLIDFRLSYPELFKSNTSFSWKVSTSNWANGRFINAQAGNKAMVVVGNFTANDSEYTVEFPDKGTWYDYINNTTLEVTSNTQKVTVPAHEYRLLLNFEVR